MPHFLAIDTATLEGLIAIGDANKPFYTHASTVQAQQSEKLLSEIDKGLNASRLTLQDIELLCVGVGPGSFTGIRIGMATIRSLAQVLKVPVLSLPSLFPALVAYDHSSHFQKAKPWQKLRIHSTLKAFRGELFAMGLETFGGELGFYKNLSSLPESRAVNAVEFGKELKKSLEEDPTLQLIVLGDGYFAFQSSVEEGFQGGDRERLHVLLKEDLDLPMGLYRAACCLFERGEATLELDKISPLYIRPSEAERKLKAGLIPAAPTIKSD